jgi:hypothetical protein
MILNNAATKIDSNVEPSKALNFGISDVRLVVDILSKLYAYPIRTLVQEYICNGRDAMREAGTWGVKPIEITVPNTLDPAFKVRDFGVGISPDRMENIFVNYGSSTKRNTNTQTGGFGIGAKSAFSYTDSFTVTSFYNGVKYLYVAHLGDEGGVNLIGRESTKEPNGVEISVGVKPKDIVEFKEAVQRCVRFWQEPIKFKGSNDITQLKPELKLGNLAAFFYPVAKSRTIFLIDGIEYDLIEESTYGYWGSKQKELHGANYIVAIEVSNGFFKVASSRERLELNDENKTKQQTLLDSCKNSIDLIVSQKINNLKLSLAERIENKNKYQVFREVSITDISLGRGYTLGKDAVATPSQEYYRHMKSRRRGSSYPDTSLTRKVYLDYVVYSGTESDSTIVRKLNFYLTTNPDAKLIHAASVALIPFQDILFTNRINVDTLPMPTRKVGQRVQKSTKDAICWHIHRNGGKSQWTVDKVNKSSGVLVFVDTVDVEAQEMAEFLTVMSIPKCNKDLVTRKGMTLEQGKKYLLSKHREGVVGLSDLPHNYKKVNVLNKFKRKTESNTLAKYLVEQFPDAKKEMLASSAEYNALVKKYPLIKVLHSLGHYSDNSAQIVIDEINKQSKEDA